MKKLIVLLCVLFIAHGLSAQIWLPIDTDLLNLESFRHQATYSIEDDLDNGIDGTDVFKVDGARIYTNLSNLVSGTERQADNSYSNETVAIGATSPIYKGWKVTAFYGNTNINRKFDGLTAGTVNTGPSTNPDFTYMTFGHMDSVGEVEGSGNMILLNVGKKMGEETEVAFTYKRTGNTMKQMADDSVYETEEDLTANETTLLYNRERSEEEEMTIPVTTYALSYSKPFKDWKLRGDLFLMTGSLNGLYSSSYRYWEDENPEEPDITFEQLDSSLENEELTATANIAGLSLRLSDFNEQTGLLWEVGGNFGMIFGSGDIEDTYRYHTISEDEFVVDEISVLDSLYTNSSTGTLSPSGNVMGINGRLEWQIAENVRFGLGGMLNTISASVEADISRRIDMRSDFNDADGAADDPDDYTITASGTDVDATETMELKANRIAIPAGIELNFGKNKDWFMRIGALAVGSKMESTEKIEYEESLSVWSIERGDGTGSTVYGTTISEENYEVTQSETYQDVYYTYGLGWKPSPNLSLDLIGLFDASGVELLSTDWVRSLKLSATINIY